MPEQPDLRTRHVPYEADDGVSDIPDVVLRRAMQAATVAVAVDRVDVGFPGQRLLDIS